MIADSFRLRAEIERDDARAGEPRFRDHQRKRFRHDRGNDDDADAVTRQERRQRACAVVTMKGNVRDLADRTNEIVIAGAAENVERFDRARDIGK